MPHLVLTCNSEQCTTQNEKIHNAQKKSNIHSALLRWIYIKY